MNTTVLKVNENECIHSLIDAKLSIRPLAQYLKDRLKTEKSVKTEFYKFLLDKLEDDDVLLNPINASDLVKHKETLELIYTILTPLMSNEEEFYWALSTPIPDEIFFSTNAFYNFFKNHDADSKENEGEEPIEEKRMKFIYNIILERFYDFIPVVKNDIIYGHTDANTGLTQYYCVQTDTKFVEINHNGKLPSLDFEDLARCFQDNQELSYLVKNLPLKNFKFEGFSIISITDVTMQHAIDNIKDALVEHSYKNESYAKIKGALKSLGGNGDLEFGLMPFFTVNGKLVFDKKSFAQSMLINSAKSSSLEEQVFNTLVSRYKENPKPFFISDVSSEKAHDDLLLEVLRAAKVKAYGILPVFYNNDLAGIIEVYANVKVSLNEEIFSKLRVAKPLIAQLYKYSIEEFNAKMDEVLMDKFTALQPSVQWKFNQAVWEFLKRKNSGSKIKQIETVTFKQLYPLFGAIDIRNSTIERNAALHKDLNILLENLMSSLRAIKKFTNLEIIDKLLFNCKDWIKRIGGFSSSNEESQLNEFLEIEVYPFLKVIRENYPNTKDIVEQYFKIIVPETGIAFENRRQLEYSMQLINTEVSQYLEKSQASLQASYPCYFAKFRTDGVEYDIYIGQEIAPDKPFNLVFLKNIRLWQLTSMVEIARLSKNLISQMTCSLQTTQLIFIHSNAIDISFRNDERRFDVEGAYNIRYEVVKKRIDKVHIKNTDERLTQPDKIALVYFNLEEQKEYKEYIKYMQGEGYLSNDLEELELEELQGVSGLKALRVGIKYPSALNLTEEDKNVIAVKQVSKPSSKVLIKN